MYTVSVKRDFVAYHFLFGGDWGLENQKHSHHYEVEIELEGSSLDKHGYLADIVYLDKNLTELIRHYKDRTLNELPEFEGVNPSVEHFSRIFCQAFLKGINAPNVSAVKVTMKENRIASASYRQEL
ncbi:MAG: 6-carboxytetrahydropterin synthase [candidate division Zixibacteria bacterium]|nr:6-carboxytetrahydropterin synthase [candidate division Zixibacteria bacterium]